MTKNGRKQRTKDAKQASNIIAIGSVIGLTVCFVTAISKSADVPLILYAIFGGGILGTENILNVLSKIFRINND